MRHNLHIVIETVHLQDDCINHGRKVFHKNVTSKTRKATQYLLIFMPSFTNHDSRISISHSLWIPHLPEEFNRRAEQIISFACLKLKPKGRKKENLFNDFSSFTLYFKNSFSAYKPCVFLACQTAVHKKCHDKLLGTCSESSFNSESTIVSITEGWLTFFKDFQEEISFTVFKRTL